MKMFKYNLQDTVPREPYTWANLPLLVLQGEHFALLGPLVEIISEEEHNHSSIVSERERVLAHLLYVPGEWVSAVFVFYELW